jgi:hypothetical protein
VGICKQITIFILYEVVSRLVAPIKCVYSSIQVSNVLVLFLARSLILSFRYTLFLFVKCLLSYIVQIIPISLESCTHSLLIYFLDQIILSTIHETMAYASSFRSYLVDTLSNRY